MANDPLEPLRKIQQQLDALRKARVGIPPNLNISNPNVNVTYSFKSSGPPSGPLPGIPDTLVEWLLEDLGPREFHDLVMETSAQLKLKGFRAGHVPRPEGLKLLKKRYERDPAFRHRVGVEWLKGRAKEDQAFRLLKTPDIRRNPWPVIEKFGFPLAIWLLLLSMGGQFRTLALQILREVTAKKGKLEEILSAAAKQPAAQELWALPSVSHDEEINRIQSEVEKILAERDQWKKVSDEERDRRERTEDDLKRLQTENQKLGQARSAAEQHRQSFELRIRELESQLAGLRDAGNRLKSLEKSLKEAERQVDRLSRERETLSESRTGTGRELDELRESQKEMGLTIRCLTAATQQDEPRSGIVYQGEVLLFISDSDPAPYFEVGKRLGLTLLAHDGRNHDAHLDRFLAQAWRIVVLGEPSRFWQGLIPLLRSSEKPYVLLPSLSDRGFERILANAQKILLKIKR